MICSTDPSKFESSKFLETVVSLLKRTERNRTEHVEGDLIVRARLLFGMHGLSRLFSLKP